MSEVTLDCKLARKHTMAEIPDALAYLLITMVPNAAVDFGSLPVNLGLVIDISGSMRGQKIKSAKEAAKLVVNSLKPVDTISVTIFSDEARAIVPATLVTDKYSIQSKIDKISIVGGTRMYHGLEAASREMKRNAVPNSINRMIILTDGETEGEEQCMNIARQEKQNKIVMTAFGIGDEYNEDFLKEISDTTLGTFYHLRDPQQIGQQFTTELKAISAAVISNVKLSLNMVSEVRLEEFYRIYPNVNKLVPDLDAGGQIASVQVGNLRKDDKTIFGAQMILPARRAGRVRIAQVFASYEVPSLQKEDRVATANVIVEYSPDAELCGRSDKEVIAYFTQLNAQNLVDKATRQTRDGNVSAATVTLNDALLLTRKAGNVPLTRQIESAIQELRTTGTISAEVMKTVKAGSGHTVKIEDDETE
jgi:Ca-activated chloride channel homolog